MVTSGTIQVTANGSVPLSFAVTVNNRNFHTAAASATQVANGTFITLPVPPQPSGSDSGLGYSNWIANYNGPNASTINDNGPNHGYKYFASNINWTTFNYRYEINPDLESSTSDFSQHQCGSGGFISWSNLLAQTRRHEYNSTTQSHHAFYSISLNSNNPGDYLEQQVGPPTQSASEFADNTMSGINSRLSSIVSASEVEPYPVNWSESGSSLGNINYAPYTSCN
jgi:hypothetical protein